MSQPINLSSRTKLIIQKSARKAYINVKPCVNNFVSLLIEIEYANPFDIRFLVDYGGKYWPLKFLQGAKAIKEEKAVQALHDAFDKHRVEQPDFSR